MTSSGNKIKGFLISYGKMSLSVKIKMDPKENINERRKEILDYLLEFGPFGVPTGTKKEFASKWEVDVRTISRDIEYVIKHVKIPKMKVLGQKFLVSCEKSMKAAAQLSQDDDPHIRAKGLKLLNQTQDQYTKMCERYGFKEVVADRLAIESETSAVTEINIIMPEGYDEVKHKANQEASPSVGEAQGQKD